MAQQSADASPQVVSGKRPFAEYELAQMVVAIVVRHEKPPRESFSLTANELYGCLWAVAERCWSTRPQNRPKIVDVIAYLHPDRKIIGPAIMRRARGAPFFF